MTNRQDMYCSSGLGGGAERAAANAARTSGRLITTSDQIPAGSPTRQQHPTVQGIMARMELTMGSAGPDSFISFTPPTITSTAQTPLNAYPYGVRGSSACSLSMV